MLPASIDNAAIESIVEPICKAHGLELVEVRYLREPGGAVLRITIDRDRAPGVPLNESGVSLEDCTSVSRDVSTALDVHDPLSTRYRLEVTSPGLDRPLVKLRDFEKFAGEDVRITTRMPVGDRRNFNGPLLGVDGQNVRIKQDGKEVSLPHSEITKANLIHRWGNKRKAS
ncbi:MAG: ribosome maturation factor RimP [Sandaracinaceae bacterium]|nr:ribosome maturation factor RimP [Sandaracinaceae bacterium]